VGSNKQERSLKSSKGKGGKDNRSEGCQRGDSVRGTTPTFDGHGFYTNQGNGGKRGREGAAESRFISIRPALTHLVGNDLGHRGREPGKQVKRKIPIWWKWKGCEPAIGSKNPNKILTNRAGREAGKHLEADVISVKKGGGKFCCNIGRGTCSKLRNSKGGSGYLFDPKGRGGKKRP